MSDTAKADDIVTRLRERAHKYDEYDWHSAIELEAAEEIERLHKLLSGEAGLLSLDTEGGGLNMRMVHPLVSAMADGMAQMVKDNNYVEMAMKHAKTGEEYRIHIQRMSRPTPHDLRRQAEAEVDRLRHDLERAMANHNADLNK